MLFPKDRTIEITGIILISIISIIIISFLLLIYILHIPRYVVYPVFNGIEDIQIEGTPFKEERFSVTIEYMLPSSCGEPYSQELEVNNTSQSVEFRLFYKSCTNCGCLAAVYYFNYTFFISLQLSGNWTLTAGRLSKNITVYNAKGM